MKIIDCDLLIIGGGLAASSAALEASKYDLNIVLVDRGRLGSSGSSPLSSGNPQVPPPVERGGSLLDGPDVLFEDMVKGGEFLSDQRMARILADEGLDSVLELEALGVPYRKKPDGAFDTFITLGMSRSRIGPILRSGQGLMQTLRKEVLHRGVTVIERVRITRLFNENNCITGAFGISNANDKVESYQFNAPAVILAAGSATGLFPVSSSALQTTGDAYALAYPLGVRFVNMEFIEFTAAPSINGVPIHTSGIKPTLGKGAKFYNRLGERFLDRVDPERLENTTRGKLIRGIYEEMEAGRGPCLMDASEVEPPTAPLRRVSTAANLDYRGTMVPWVPAVHTFLGGIWIDDNGKTDYQGLYAAGESAGQGRVFGADRVGGAVAACQVFGKRAGKAAALELTDSKCASSLIDNVRQAKEEYKRLKSLIGTGEKPAVEIYQELHDLSWRGIGIKRDEQGVSEACSRFKEIFKKPEVLVNDDQGLHQAIDLANLALTGYMVATAALARNESRGQHWRQDYPQIDDKWLKWVVIKGSDDDKLILEVMDLSLDFVKPEGRNK